MEKGGQEAVADLCEEFASRVESDVLFTWCVEGNYQGFHRKRRTSKSGLKQVTEKGQDKEHKHFEKN